ncbi:MAG: hypothetical protein R2941_10075 [Desulfobacterales bacterium]
MTARQGQYRQKQFLLTVTPDMPPIVKVWCGLQPPNQDLLTEDLITIDENQQPELIKLRVKDSDSKSLTVSLESDNTVLVPQQYAGFQD